MPSAIKRYVASTLASITASVWAMTAVEAATVSIDFDAGSGTGTLYQEDGYSVRGPAILPTGGLGTPSPALPLGVAGFFPSVVFAPQLTVTNTEGLTFDLLSFDKRCVPAPGSGTSCPSNVILSGIYADGTAAPRTVVNATSAWTTKAVDGFTGLISFTLRWDGGTNTFIDSVVVDTNTPLTPVPLPAGLPLFLAGLGAFAFVRNRSHVRPD